MQVVARLLASAVLAASVTGMVTDTQAAPTRKCYVLDPFIDVLNLVFDDATLGHQLVYGNWYASGLYSVAVSGAFEPLPGGGGRHLGIVGAIFPSSTNGNLICSIGGTIAGPFDLQCAGNGEFQNSGTSITHIACGSLPPPAKGGRAALSK